ncbi:MAG: hypothetical protein DMD76_18775 [Candidatus Rokuibacteriota bacterium]|nr:MAG: hypothetical protein DMD76_18775 [Candidatus Rokubacteria bacterium]
MALSGIVRAVILLLLLAGCATIPETPPTNPPVWKFACIYDKHMNPMCDVMPLSRLREDLILWWEL